MDGHHLEHQLRHQWVEGFPAFAQQLDSIYLGFCLGSPQQVELQQDFAEALLVARKRRWLH
jgi:hypothetical protein